MIQSKSIRVSQILISSQNCTTYITGLEFGVVKNLFDSVTLNVGFFIFTTKLGIVEAVATHTCDEQKCTKYQI